MQDVYKRQIYGDLTGFPPMLIQAGGYELFLDDGMKLAKKAAADNVKVTLTVYPDVYKRQGMSLTPRDFKNVFDHPKNIALGTLFQFIFMPALAFALVKLLSLIHI